MDWFILNVEAIVEVDITALDALEDLRAEVTSRGITFGLAHVKQDLLDDLDAYGLTTTIGPQMIFPTMRAAITAHETRPAGPRQPPGADQGTGRSPSE